MDTIYRFMDGALEGRPKSFGELYHTLVAPDAQIGLRRGVIPIYIAVALHIYKGRTIIYNGNNPVDISADILLQINSQPEQFSFERIDWSKEKEVYIRELEDIFEQYIASVDGTGELYEHVAQGMYSWYLSLPKYAKELMVSVSGDPLKKEYLKIIKSIKNMQSANELIFQKMPQVLGLTDIEPDVLARSISEAKALFDEAVPTLIDKVAGSLRDIFSMGQPERASLQSIMQDWCESLPEGASEELFEDGTNRFLSACHQSDSSESDWLLQVAKIATGLRFNDWDNNTLQIFCDKVAQYKETAESYVGESKDYENEGDAITSGYEFSFVNAKGKLQRRRFEVVDYTPRAKLLLNSIKGDIEAMGQSISEKEKRQVVAEILQNLC